MQRDDAGEDLSWIPGTCANGHELGPGKLSLSWVWCTCKQPASNGHHVAYCRVDGCGAEPRRPPGCSSVRDQR